MSSLMEAMLEQLALPPKAYRSSSEDIVNNKGWLKGWKREEIAGRPGLNDHKHRVIYYSPAGRKFVNKAQMQRFFGNSVDLTVFDYQTGRFDLQALKRANDKRNPLRSLSMPIRMIPYPPPTTVKIQVIKSQQESKVNHDLKPSGNGSSSSSSSLLDKPRQIFWEKRLEKLTSINLDRSESYEECQMLPGKLATVGPNVNEMTAVRSIAAALHLNSTQKVIGQSDTRILEKNPSVFINPKQPLVAALVISDEDIRKQEEKVRQARSKLKQVWIRGMKRK